MVKKTDPIIIAGAGIAGCYAALSFAKKGFTVILLEKYSMNDMIDNNSKRTFNITIYGYGLSLLKRVGVWKDLSHYVVPLKGSVTQINNTSKPIVAANNNLSYYAVKRAAILKALLNALKKHKNIQTQFGAELVKVNPERKTVTIKASGKTQTISYELLLGADGAHSTVRKTLQELKGAKLKQEYSKYSYRQIAFTAQDIKKLHLNPDYAYTWTRENAVIATFPNKNRTITAILILSKNKLMSLNSEAKIQNFILSTYPDLLPAIRSISSSILKNPTGNFLTVTTNPWTYKNSIALIGDSAHAFNPFFGQGVSSALGDVKTLTQIYSQERDKAQALSLYEKRRKPNMDAMAQLSKEGIKAYMRTKRADYNAIYSKIEDIFHQFFPKFVMPSIFEAIVVDPENTDFYRRRHQNQRKVARLLGVDIMVRILTMLVGQIEKRQTTAYLQRA